MTTKSKVIAGGFGVLFGTIVIGMGLYLPFYSQAARNGEEARRQLHKTHARGENTPGGMWKNLNDAAKHAKEDVKSDNTLQTRASTSSSLEKQKAVDLK
jgi:hypothetical protein